MNAVNRPIVKPGHAERAAVADTLAQDFPGVTEIVAIFPCDLGHVAEMFGLGLAEAKGDGGLELVFERFFNAMCGHAIAAMAYAGSGIIKGWTAFCQCARASVCSARF